MNPAWDARRCSRRQAVQVGYSGALGLGLENLCSSRAKAAGSIPARRAKSVIFVFLTGAPSQIDTFDMKPEAPAEIRGDFRPISTRTPGIQICEHLPLLAQRMDKMAIVRSVTCGRELAAHDFGTHAILAGVNQPPNGPTRAASRLAWPCYSAGLDYVRPRSDGLPNGVHLPSYLADAGVGAYPGQNAGFLGAGHDPWQIIGDPSHRDFQVANLSMPIGLSVKGFSDRCSLLERIDRQRADMARMDQAGHFSHQQKKAAEFLHSSKLATAFAIEREPDRTRDRYGRHQYGQSLLLARRLVEAAVPIIQVNMGVFTAHWDTHVNNCKMLKEQLLPPLDQSVAALLDDLDARGLLAETLVLMMGEFGRTPRLGGNLGTPTFSPSGRDHWTDCFFAVFAGAGVCGGRTIGSSDRIAAYPRSSPFHPADIGATIYSALGVDSNAEIHDRLGRPMRLNMGEPIHQLYSALG